MNVLKPASPKEEGEQICAILEPTYRSKIDEIMQDPETILPTYNLQR